MNPRVFVLRNNDIGDLLVVTPLFEALKRRFPAGAIIAGIGDWNRPVLDHNPFVDEIISINAPWHNKQVCKHPQNSLPGRIAVLRYLAFSAEARALRNRRPDIGIDVLGSPQGALLFCRAGIPRRLGVRGYHGTGRWMSDCLDFDRNCYVGKAALNLMDLLGTTADQHPEVRPQIYLSKVEQHDGENLWAEIETLGRRRLVVGFGGGFETKCWPLNRFRAVLERLACDGGWSVALVGGGEDIDKGQVLAQGLDGVYSLVGKTTLRQTFALTAACHQVLTNSSMLMHVAAAFEKATVVVLGADFESAREHAQLWSCNPKATILGPEESNRVVPCSELVWDTLRKMTILT